MLVHRQSLLYNGAMRMAIASLSLLIPCGCGDDGPSPQDSTTGGSDPTSAMTSSAPTGMTMPQTGSDPSTTNSTPSQSSGEASNASTGTEPEGPDVDVSDPQLYEFELEPADLDPSVVDNIETQYAHLDTRAEPVGKLVFFLSGFTNTPAAWRNHGRHLASYGFHVVEPHYSNGWSCGGMGGSCNADTRWEALTGEDTSTVLDTSRADSAEGRVVTMLLHLAEVHPGGDWGYYLNEDDTLRDEHVIIAGISHGAASTGLFATRRPFARAVMHSGGWGGIDESSETPIDAFYALSHSDDEQHAGHLSSWDQAGLLGAPTVIEEGGPPFGDSHRLIASTPNGYPHCSVVVHGESPVQDDEFVFDPAWRYMYGAPAAQ